MNVRGQVIVDGDELVASPGAGRSCAGRASASRWLPRARRSLPEFRRVPAVSLVGATYGIRSTPLGAVGLVGPLRMDYDKAIRTVRAAAFELSRFVEDVYEDA